MSELRRSSVLPLLALGLGSGVALVLWQLAPAVQVYLRASLALVVLEAGVLASVVIALVVVLRRRSVRERAKAGAAAAELVREEHRRFMRRLDHELKNPLTAIRAGLANAAAGWSAGSEPSLVLPAIEEQVMRLSRLVNDLRKLAEVGDRPVMREPVDVGQLLADVAAAAGNLPDVGKRRIAVSVPQVPWPLPPVLGDEDLLLLALWNLVTNSVKYSADDATVELRGFEEHGAVTVEVADTGMGIPAGEARQVWEELVRGSASRGVSGSGLGLPLVRTIVARHGGDCELRSQLGAGTVIRIRFPACGNASSPQSLQSTETATSVGQP